MKKKIYYLFIVNLKVFIGKNVYVFRVDII